MRMFAGGKAGWCRTGDRELGSLGDGIVLYFQLLRAMAVVFTIMTLISIPQLVLNASGSRVRDLCAARSMHWSHPASARR